MDPRREGRLASLTGLRFVAALGVLLFHYGDPLVAGAPAWVLEVVRGGYVWVGLFYLLSGFVLAWAHPRPLGPVERRSFYAARLARLYPAYLVGFVLSIPFATERWLEIGPAAAAKLAIVAAATLLLAQGWITPIARLWNPPGWSTSATAAFYAVFPFAAARLARLSRRGLGFAAALLWLAGLALPLAYLVVAPDGPAPALLEHEPLRLAALKFHPLARVGEFLAGVALGLLARRGVTFVRHAGLAATAGLGAALAVLATGRVPFLLLHDGLLLPLFAVAILALARGDGLLAHALASRPARTLGDASFALYILQDPLWRIARAASGSAPPSSRFVLGYVATAVGIALAVARLVERPARRVLQAALAPPPVRAGAD